MPPRGSDVSSGASRLLIPSALHLKLKGHSSFAIILAAYLGLGLLYSVITPVFEASDEIWHYPFVQYLAAGNGLPIQDPDNVQLWRQEGSQPPLYYALAALATLWIDTRDLAVVLWLNPHAQIGLPVGSDNANLIVHTSREAFPYLGTVLAVHLARLLSILFGSLTVWATYGLAREVLPKQPGLAWGASALVAFNPMFLFISGSVNNDNAVNALASLSLWGLACLAHGFSWARLISLGVLIGLASLSKISGLGLVPLSFVVIGLIAYRHRSLILALKAGSVLLIVTGTIAGWWYLRNWQLYGDPLGWNVFVAIVGERHPAPTLLQLLGERVGFMMSFWGFFGGLNVPAEPWFYGIYNAVASLGFAGLVVYAVRRWRRPELYPSSRVGLWIVGVWPTIVLAGLTRWASTTLAAQGRLIFPALASIALLLVLGLSQWVPPRWQRLLMGGLACVTFGLALLAPLRYIAPAYAPPPNLNPAEVGALPTMPRVNFGGQMELLGHALDQRNLRPGEALAVTLSWRSRAPMDRDWSVFIHLVDENGVILAQRDSYPGLGKRPTTLWRVGDSVADTYRLTLPPTTYAPSQAQIVVGLYAVQTGQRLPVLDSQGRPIADHLQIEEVNIAPRPGPLPNPISINFDNRIALVGYQLDRRSARPGESLHLTLYWQALSPLQQDYTVFTHILGPPDRIWAQEDSQPQDGAAPTSTWRPGQVIEDDYLLRLHPETPSGVYELEIGLYLPDTGQRLVVLGPGGFVQDNRVVLTKIRVN